MSDPQREARLEDEVAPEGLGNDRRLDELRSLLLGDHAESIDEMAGRVARIEREQGDPELQRDRVARALPDAIRAHEGTDTDLQRALQPDVELMLFRSVREHPDRMAEVIYPIMGPVIRKIVEKLFERSRDTGVQPYNIEQLFLIHRESGLLLAHVGQDDVPSGDADMVSGMLSAIRSYVQEAFGSEDFDGLRMMHVGDVNIRVEWGPVAVLAAVVRGVEPIQLQPSMQSLLEALHRDHAEQFDRFDGDSDELADVPLRLREVLDEHAVDEPPPIWQRHARRILFCMVAAGVIAFFWHQRDERRWQRMVDRLDGEPGIVVLDADAGARSVRLLKDPDARDPASLPPREGQTDLADVDIRIDTYISADDAMRLKRATRLLEPPDGAALRVEGSTLSVAAVVDATWLIRARQQLGQLPGIDALRQRVEDTP